MSEILEAIRRRAEMATEGPWVEDPESYIVNRGDDMICADLLTHADAEFIAHARTDIPRLLGALDAADKKLSDRMNMLRDTADGFLQAVIDMDVHRDPELANRYDAYAGQARAALIAFRAVVNDALEAS